MTTPHVPMASNAWRSRGGGGPAAYRCGIDGAAIDGDVTAYDTCAADWDCAAELSCYFGYGVASCPFSAMDAGANDAACADQPADPRSATCSFRLDGGGGLMSGVCAIPCEMGDACPGDLACEPLGGGGGGIYYCSVPGN